jgi:replication factor C subunit 3/5
MEIKNYIDLPWVEKYRPSDLNSIISHEDILNTLKNLINNNKLPHLIFYGPPGTGKTTTILACAKKIYGENYKSIILELNGSDERGISVVREHIKEFSNTQIMLSQIMNIECKYKLVILDEADSMTIDAQFALRRVIENCSNNTRFCIICNYLTKIIPGIQSRCAVLKFSPIQFDDHNKYINNIINLENINISEDCINNIIKISEGDMRKSINILQSLFLINSTNIIITKDLYKMIGYLEPEKSLEMMNYLFEKKSLNEIYTTILKFKEEYNLSINDILKELSQFLLKNTNLSTSKLIEIFDKLAQIEVYLTNNVNQDIQLCAIISALK